MKPSSITGLLLLALGLALVILAGFDQPLNLRGVIAGAFFMLAGLAFIIRGRRSA